MEKIVYIVLGRSHAINASDLETLEKELLKEINERQLTLAQAPKLYTSAVEAYDSLKVLFGDITDGRNEKVEKTPPFPPDKRTVHQADPSQKSAKRQDVEQVLKDIKTTDSPHKPNSESLPNIEPESSDCSGDMEYYVDMLIRASKVSRKQAIDALKKCDGDYVNAAMVCISVTGIFFNVKRNLLTSVT